MGDEWRADFDTLNGIGISFSITQFGICFTDSYIVCNQIS